MSAALALHLAAVPPVNVLYLAAALFAVGLVGVACRRNVLVMLLSVEILLNAANLAFVAFSKVHGDDTGQIFVFFAMTIAAAEVAVGLAIVIAVYRLRRVVDADAAQDLHETHVGEVPPIRPEGPAGDHGHGHHDEQHKGVPGDHAAPSAGADHAPAHDAPAHAETHEMPLVLAAEHAEVVTGDFTAWIILFAPLAAAVLCACIPFIRKNGAIASFLSIAAIGAGLFLTLTKYFLPSLGGHGMATHEAIVSWVAIPGLAIGFGTRVDALATTMMLVVTGVGLAIHVYSLGYMHDDPSKGRFFGKLSLFVFSMLGIVVSPNFIQTFCFWELVGVSSYLLIGYYWQKDSAGEAAKKAFMTNRVGDFGFLLGILVIWSAAGGWKFDGHQTFDFEALRALVTGTGDKAYDASMLGGFAAIGGALVFCGAMGKSAQFPLHVWLPDAMEGPTPVSALMHAATMVAAGVFMIIRCFFLFEGTTWAPTLVAWLGGITALLAATMAMVQRDIKKILAYSTLSQLGYMTLALGAGAYSGAMFHLTTHAFFKALLFLGAGSVIHACHTQDIFEMGGLRKAMPSTYRTFLIGTLALCGIFPFAGFWSKDEILSSVLHADGLPGHVLLYGLGTFVAGLTSFYMGRCFVVTFLGTNRGAVHGDAHGHGHAEAAHHEPHESPPVMTLPLWFLAIFAVGVGFVGIPDNLSGHGGNRFEHFLDAWSMKEGAFHVNVALISTVFAVAGLLIAWRMYRPNPGRDPLPEKLGFLHRLFVNLWYVDAFYLWLVQRVQQGIAFVSWLFERNVIIGALVNGTSQGTRIVGDRLRRVQSGRLTSYVSWLLLGTVALALAVLWR